jgi:hypothetical protein
VGKVYNLCRVKTDILAVLTVKSGLDPNMINELEDELNRGPWFMVIVDHVYGYGYAVSLLSLLMWVFFMNLYLSNQVLIKLDQLKLLIAVSQSAFPYFWPSCHIIPNTC